jgi:hypothetical protein|tara:strand:+ start:2509 stop:2802 length:294 start_codon:yes stop_codon:yes gene_type:complete
MSSSDTSDTLPINARSKLRTLLQSLAAPGDFAGGITLAKDAVLPVISIPQPSSDSGKRTRARRNTLRLPVEKATQQYDALVKVLLRARFIPYVVSRS